MSRDAGHDLATRDWLRRSFAAYYRTDPLVLPPRFTTREWGFLGWGGRGMRRHMAFRSRRALVGRLAHDGPPHVYHSVAYYAHPSRSSMETKGWQGADVVFDLDADHVPGCEGRPFGELMRVIRDQTVRLVENFLMGDLALDPDELQLCFSGGRGYHVHVRTPALRGLGAGARRELVDYVAAHGLDHGGLLMGAGHTKKYGERSFDTGEAGLPPRDAPGWAGRVARHVERYLKKCSELSSDERLTELQTLHGVGKVTAEAIKLTGDPRSDFAALTPGVQRTLLERATSREAVHPDEPVTGDLHRLIRLPGSLHGGSGLAVRVLTLDRLRDFEPLRDATVFGDDPVMVRGKPTNEGVAKVARDGETFAVAPGEVAELPAWAAVYLMCRRQVAFTRRAA